MQHNVITRAVIGGALRVYSILGPGFLESVYRNALACELHKRRLVIELEQRLQVRYDHVLVGEFVADLVIDGCVIVELKAVSALTRAHEAQLFNYLVATGVDVGLLMNFGAPRLEIRRRTRDVALRRSRNGTALQDDGRTTTRRVQDLPGTDQ